MTKGSHFSPEALARVRAVNKRTHSGEKNHNWGGGNIKVETRAKMSAAKKGRKLSTETCHRMSEAHRGEKNYNWNGGRKRDPRGYILVFVPSHPYGNCEGYVYEHRLVMEAHLGRTLLPTEVVHHINGIKNDNRIENLMLFSSNEGHASHHAQLKRG